MAKLYPPSIEGKLPACGGESLVIPFIMNRAVSEESVTRMVAIIKTISTGRTVATLNQGTLVKNDSGYAASFDDKKENGQITNLNIGQYYKVQIAYVNKNDIGYYSSVGTFKRTTFPSVRIPALEDNFFGGYEYTGVYSQEGGDETEKIYSYCFELTDMDGNIVDTSGVQLHNSENDRDTATTQDTWKSNIELIKDNPYYLTYKVTTLNNLTASSPRYTTISEDSIDIDLDLCLQTQLNPDEGCIELYVAPAKSASVVISGSFVLVRASSKNNFNSWDEVYRFSYLNTPLSKKTPKLLWEDCTVEQGEEYLYALQAYNSRNLYSNRLNAKNGKVKVDFVDAFLYDGKRQLKIQFNPKISSFKNNILETKMDTLGSKYPFIFRNGYVHYKEFQISGLISLLSDESDKFMGCNICKYRKTCALSSNNIRCSKYEKDEEIDAITKRVLTPSIAAVTDTLKTDLSAENVYNERQFKLTVLEWLNNGEAKIFRSPTEGNYIVRLMNVSLTPNDTLGRMLHTFQCTAYEIADWNFKNLVNAKLIELPQDNMSTLKIGQIMPAKMVEVLKESQDQFKDDYPLFTLENDTNIFMGKGVYGAYISEATPGTIVNLIFSGGSKENTSAMIEIGGTGAYYIQTREYPLTGLQLVSGQWSGLKLTFEYYDDTPTDTFSNIADLKMTDEIRRFIGPGYQINIPSVSSVADSNHIISDIRREVGNFHYIRVEKRFIQDMWKNTDGKWCRNKVGNDIIADDEWNPVVIYHDCDNNIYYNGNSTTPLYTFGLQNTNEPDFRFRLNSPSEKVYTDLGPRATKPYFCLDCESYGDKETHCEHCGSKNMSTFHNSFGRIDAIRNVGNVDTLQIGNGLIADVAYRVRTKIYVVENEDADTILAKANWEKAQSEISARIRTHQSTKKIQEAINAAHEKYAIFISKLKIALQRRGVKV